ncbi:Uncharacterized protein FWK35_00036894 [Aphis craccivora]|uniref:Uncharacterized protein n=1 Tax=Aphis craccivora TaxID=307492 RepID=A0A6G0VII6_APHCR|nr:Uncharacterized protein FWK35_00036894 [Aphis craccivora]
MRIKFNDIIKALDGKQRKFPESRTRSNSTATSFRAISRTSTGRFTIKKKPELIDICISQNLKSTGTVRELRARLSKFFKGNIELDDIRETLTEREKQAVINISVEHRIKTEGIELEENSEEENDYYNLKTKEEVEKSKQLYENINTKAQDITNKIEKIINNVENQYINNSDNT